MAGCRGALFGALSGLIVVVSAACSGSSDNGSNNSALGDAGTGAAGNGGASAMGGAPGTGNAAQGPGTCGNGVLDPGEDCEGTTTTATCASVTMNSRPIGTVGCAACSFDTSSCRSAGAADGGVVGAGGSFGAGGGPSGTGNTGNTGIGGAASTGGATGSTGGSSSGDPLDALRQVCVDTINQYRATLGLPALSRPSASVEACSDQGAQEDATAGVAHGSAGNCPGMNAQDTCPGWNPARYGGVEGALKQCLAQMWAEGAPPVPRDQCIADYQNCFLKYGHYLNMSSPTSQIVSCGFYTMSNGDVWMNQDFGR